jgi:hypothetical protein
MSSRKERTCLISVRFVVLPEPLTNFGQGSAMLARPSFASSPSPARGEVGCCALGLRKLRDRAASLPLPLRERIASPHVTKSNAWARLVRGEKPSQNFRALLIEYNPLTPFFPAPSSHAIITPVPHRLPRMAMRRGGTGAWCGETTQSSMPGPVQKMVLLRPEKGPGVPVRHRRHSNASRG